MTDTFDLKRFVDAQEPVIRQAMEELRAGRKRSHWMWFVFPQLKGLGHSSMATHYGIGSLDEARAYLAHPVLGPRLEACTQAVLQHPDKDLRELLGSPDDLKFRSSMTLFAKAAGDASSIFRQALGKFCNGAEDQRTLDLIAGTNGSA